MPYHLDPDIQDVQPSSGKLILPAPPEDAVQSANPQTVSAWTDQPMYSPMPLASTTAYPQYSPLSPKPSTSTRGRWRKDPAYLVLTFAIALVMISAIAFVVFGATTILSSNNLASSQTPIAPTPSGTVDAKPNLGTTPTTGSGSSQPSSIPTPNLNTQPSPSPTAQPGQGLFSVQIVSIPNVVPNNSRVQVGVQTSQPGVQVRLQVTYNTAPFFFNSGTRITDNNGQAVLLWNVTVFSRHPVQATVRVNAIDQNGQQISSQTVTVMVG